ncbi:MAG: class I SAM-dependent methyltransferase [bacterium]
MAGQEAPRNGASGAAAGIAASSSAAEIAALLASGVDARAVLLEFADANQARPRMLLALSRLFGAHVASHADDRAAVERLADLSQRLAALDADHAAWFAGIPNHLLMKVNGSPDRKPFVQVGAHVTRLLRDELPVLREAGAVLDFGVGLCRVLWPMMQEVPDAELIGFDVDPMILTQTEKLGLVSEARFVHSTQPIADGTIDALYAISVFTHLRTTVDFWLGEIHRVLSDRGQALLTFHDETLYADLRAKGQIPRNTPAECRERMFVGGGTEGSTQLAVFYETPYWEECLRRFFVVEKTAPRGLHGNQSYSVVRKRAVAVDHERLRHEYLCALEEELYRLRLAKKLMF